MAHLTKKKLAQREKNNLMRAFNPKNTGTITMSSKKDYKRTKLIKEVDYAL